MPRQREPLGRIRRWTFVGVAIAATLLFVRLGLWQLERHFERRALNEARRERLALPAVSLEEALAEADSALWRRVRVSGRWDPPNELIVRARPLLGTPGVWVATPLRPGPSGDPSGAPPRASGGAGAPAVVVVRGWLPAADGLSADIGAALPPARDTTVTGVALPFEPARPQPVRVRRFPAGPRLVAPSLDAATVAGALPYPVAPFLLRVPGPEKGGAWSGPAGLAADAGDDMARRGATAATDSPAGAPAPTAGPAGGAPRPLPPPELSAGPHLTYVFQWFGFAVIVAAGAALFLRGRRETGAPGPPPEETPRDPERPT